MTAAPMVVRAALGCELRIHPQEYELSLTVAHKREVRFAVNFLRFHFASASYMVGVFRDAIVVLPMLDQALKLLGKSLDFVLRGIDWHFDKKVASDRHLHMPEEIDAYGLGEFHGHSPWNFSDNSIGNVLSFLGDSAPLLRVEILVFCHLAWPLFVIALFVDHDPCIVVPAIRLRRRTKRL
jgi:hypothetical protein